MTTNQSNIWSKIKVLRQKYPVLAELTLMVVIGAVFLWICLIFLDFWTHHGDNATVPEIKGLNYAEAERTLSEHGLAIEISDSIYDTSIAHGTVVESWPKAGSVVKDGRTVYVTVTAFSPKQVTISMPITGVSMRQALSYLNALGVSNIRQVSVPSQYPDLVESAHAGGRPIGVGSVIPVDAAVVLEVGIAIEPTEETPSDSISAESLVEEELSEFSSYEE